jgi:hypothetical protein
MAATYKPALLIDVPAQASVVNPSSQGTAGMSGYSYVAGISGYSGVSGIPEAPKFLGYGQINPQYSWYNQTLVYSDEELPLWLKGIKDFCTIAYRKELAPYDKEIEEIDAKIASSEVSREVIYELYKRRTFLLQEKYEIWQKHKPLDEMLKDMEKSWCLENLVAPSEMMYEHILNLWFMNDAKATPDTLKYLEGDSSRWAYSSIKNRYGGVANAFVEWLKSQPLGYSGFSGYSGIA